LQQLGSDVMELLDWLAIEKVLVCGISLGGMTALWLASHLGGRIRGIIAANTAARIGSVTSWNERIALVESEGMDALARIVPQRWLTARFRSGHPEVVRACEAMVRATPAQGYIGCCSAIRDMDLSHDLNKIDVPVLIISGKHDQMTTTADAQILGKQIAGALHVQLSAAHLSNLECATEFNAAVMEFLRSETER
jgi:3-oxoadipate enol-lactonase